MVLQVNRWGNSLAVRLPKAIAAEAGLTEGAAVEVTTTGDGTVTIVRIQADNVYRLEDLMRGVSRRKRHALIEPAGPVGREI
jgi:antitoxin MazE